MRPAMQMDGARPSTETTLTVIVDDQVVVDDEVRSIVGSRGERVLRRAGDGEKARPTDTELLRRRGVPAPPHDRAGRFAVHDDEFGWARPRRVREVFREESV